MQLRNFLLVSATGLACLMSPPVRATPCQDYAVIASAQARHAEYGIYRTSPIGPAQKSCKGFDPLHPRWSRTLADHFVWCEGGATVAQRAAELEARRAVLLRCTADREKLLWPSIDLETCSTRQQPRCTSTPDAYGKNQCEQEGRNILEINNSFRRSRQVLWDYRADRVTASSIWYHQFNHWSGFRCVIRPGTAGTRSYKLEGITRQSQILKQMLKESGGFAKAQ